jgi:CubicO group peptidase (beta-lactamase class C family)
MFTAVAVCQLIEQGKLTLESKIKDILPYDLKTIDAETTVFHLLTHSSGIADYLDFDDKESEDRFFDTHPVNKWTTNEYYLPLFNERPRIFELGSKSDYSNSNFILLGLIIETISKESYHAYINQNIIEPLQMTRTGFHATNNLPANTAIGYMWVKKTDEFVGNYYRLPIIGAADGGVYTTAADMRLFWDGLFEGKLLSKNMLDKFLTPHTRFDDIDGHIGLGIFVSERNGETIYWHDGGDAGVGFHTAYFPSAGYIMTVSSNVTKKAINIWDFNNSLMSLLVSKND